MRQTGISPVCAEDKLLPEVYLLGAPKCGTTELADDLMMSGIRTIAETSSVGPIFPGYWKEWHFFLRWWRWNNNTWDLENFREDWFADMPSCSTSGNAAERNIAGDFSVTQTALVPLGDGWSLVDTELPGDVHVGDINLPQTLSAIYSYYVGTGMHKLKFIINFREPLSRMQSHWYHMNETHLLSMNFDLSANFSQDVARASDEFEQGRITLLLWYSLYGRQVQQFMSAFSPNQFIFIPYLYYLQLAKEEVCSTMSEFLRYPVTCKEVVEANTTFNHHDHPSLEEDVSPSLMERFQRTIADENRLLVEQLLAGYQEGATLPQFQGSPSFEAIDAWLRGGW